MLVGTVVIEKGESVTIVPTSPLKQLLELDGRIPKGGRMPVTEKE